MSIRSFVVLLLCTALVLSFGSAYFITIGGNDFLSVNFPGLLPSEPARLLHVLLLAQLVGLLLSAVVIALIAYVFFSIYIADPIVTITEAMETFAKGEPILLPEKITAPSELTKLANIFRTFSTNVTSAHTHDTEVSRVKSDFISTAAHQFRTPLTGIKWSLEALERENLTPEQHALVAGAVSKSRDLVAIVGTLLDVSAIESGKYNYVFTQVNVASLCTQVINDFMPLAKETRVHVSFTPLSADMPAVRADNDRIKWVLNNLIENAIRYTPADGFVTCSVRETATSIEVIIRDTGIGIKNQDKNNIFERFYRAGNAITKENKGSGLGLYIARTIATDHGGDLTFSANPEGPGTSFILSLPVAS